VIGVGAAVGDVYDQLIGRRVVVRAQDVGCGGRSRGRDGDEEGADEANG